jgi:hypothetical protein
MSTAMSTASITHHRLPMAAAAAVAATALAFAFAGLTVLHDDASPVPVQHSTIVDNCRKHAGRLPTPATEVGLSCASTR